MAEHNASVLAQGSSTTTHGGTAPSKSDNRASGGAVLAAGRLSSLTSGLNEYHHTDTDFVSMPSTAPQQQKHAHRQQQKQRHNNDYATGDVAMLQVSASAPSQKGAPRQQNHHYSGNSSSRPRSGISVNPSLKYRDSTATAAVADTVEDGHKNSVPAVNTTQLAMTATSEIQSSSIHTNNDYNVNTSRPLQQTSVKLEAPQSQSIVSPPYNLQQQKQQRTQRQPTRRAESETVSLQTNFIEEAHTASPVGLMTPASPLNSVGNQQRHQASLFTHSSGGGNAEQIVQHQVPHQLPQQQQQQQLLQHHSYGYKSMGVPSPVSQPPLLQPSRAIVGCPVFMVDDARIFDMLASFFVKEYYSNFPNGADALLYLYDVHAVLLWVSHARESLSSIIGTRKNHGMLKNGGEEEKGVETQMPDSATVGHSDVFCESASGKDKIVEFFSKYELEGMKPQVKSCKSLPSLPDSFMVFVTGLMWIHPSLPPREFAQTFVVASIRPGWVIIRNDILQFFDTVPASLPPTPAAISNAPLNSNVIITADSNESNRSDRNGDSGAPNKVSMLPDSSSHPHPQAHASKQKTRSVADASDGNATRSGRRDSSLKNNHSPNTNATSLHKQQITQSTTAVASSPILPLADNMANTQHATTQQSYHSTPSEFSSNTNRLPVNEPAKSFSQDNNTRKSTGGTNLLHLLHNTSPSYKKEQENSNSVSYTLDVNQHFPDSPQTSLSPPPNKNNQQTVGNVSNISAPTQIGSRSQNRHSNQLGSRHSATKNSPSGHPNKIVNNNTSQAIGGTALTPVSGGRKKSWGNMNAVPANSTFVQPSDSQQIIDNSNSNAPQLNSTKNESTVAPTIQDYTFKQNISKPAHSKMSNALNDHAENTVPVKSSYQQPTKSSNFTDIPAPDNTDNIRASQKTNTRPHNFDPPQHSDAIQSVTSLGSKGRRRGVGARTLFLSYIPQDVDNKNIEMQINGMLNSSPNDSNYRVLSVQRAGQPNKQYGFVELGCEEAVHAVLNKTLLFDSVSVVINRSRPKNSFLARNNNDDINPSVSTFVAAEDTTAAASILEGNNESSRGQGHNFSHADSSSGNMVSSAGRTSQRPRRYSHSRANSRRDEQYSKENKDYRATATAKVSDLADAYGMNDLPSTPCEDRSSQPPPQKKNNQKNAGGENVQRVYVTKEVGALHTEVPKNVRVGRHGRGMAAHKQMRGGHEEAAIN